MNAPRKYTADPAAASQVGTSNYVDESGKYIGEITLAESVTSKRGTEGIEIAFLTREGQQANYLTLWTFNESGESLYGFKILSALMAVMGIKDIEPKQGEIKDRDGNPRRVIAYPALHKKPVGLVLQKEFYTKQDGSGGYKFNIIVPFNAKTELTAKEMQDGVTQPKVLAGVIATLKDKGVPVETRPAANQSNGYANATGGGYDDPFGDDFGQGF